MSEHDQKAVDDLCRHIRAECLPVTLEEMLASVSSREGAVFHQMITHEDHCKTMRTGNGDDCTCDPSITIYRQKTS
jgi:hypothetical protein